MDCCDPDHSDAPPEPTDSGRTEADDWDWIRLAIGAFLGGNAMIVGLSINTSTMPANERLFVEIALLGSTIVVFELLGRRLLASAWNALSEGRITFEFLFLAGIVGATGASLVSMFRGQGPVYFEVASLLLVIYAAGDKMTNVSRRRGVETAQSWAVDEATCRIRTDCGGERSVPLEDVSHGDVVLVDPGETVPVDGTIASGEGFVRDAHVTGESLSTVKRVGDVVYAGSEVLDASLAVEAEAVEGERMIDTIRTSVEEAWQTPSEWQREADRIVQWFFPMVAVATLATFGYWSMVGSWQEALFNGLSVLLIACPCALGFAVPLAVWMTLGRYAERGFVTEESDIVERLARSDVVVFDKTGTLTDSAAHLVDLVARDGARDKGSSRDEVVELARTLEGGSDHPVAAAFRDMDRDRASSPTWRLLASEPIPGVGIRGRIEHRESGEQHEVAVGQEALVPQDERAAFRATLDDLRRHEGERQLAILLDGRVVGAAAVAERPADRIGEMLDTLSRLDVRPILVTGDREERAERLGFDEVYAETTPEEKAELVRDLGESGHEVLVVGDGVNDASAMAAAYVSVAVSDGSEWTIDVADVTWHGSDPTVMAEVIARARKTVSLIRSNLSYAVVYNVVGIGAAATGWLHPVLAAVLMVASSLFVTWRTALTLDTSTPVRADGSAPRGKNRSMATP